MTATPHVSVLIVTRRERINLGATLRSITDWDLRGRSVDVVLGLAVADDETRRVDLSEARSPAGGRGRARTPRGR